MLNRLNKLNSIGILILGMSIAIGMSGCSFWGNRTGPETILGNGTIETTEVDISAKYPGKIIELNVDEGDGVEKGKVIARLDDSEIAAAIEQSKAVIATAKANLANLQAGARKEEIAQAQENLSAAKSNWENMTTGYRQQEIDTAKANLKQAESNFEKAKLDWNRMQKLFEEGAISAQQRDETKNAYTSALSQTESAKAQLNLVQEGYRPPQIETARYQYQAAKKQLDLLLAGFRPEEINAARHQLTAAEASLKQLLAQQSNMVLSAPMNGVILVKDMEIGDLANVGSPIVTLGDLDNVWLRVYVGETDIGKIKPGQDASITVDSYPNKHFPGKVGEISSQAEFTPKNVQTKKERVNLVYGIKVYIKSPEHLLKPGMPADAEIPIGK